MQLEDDVADDLRALRDDRVAEGADARGGSVHPTGKPMNHSHHVGLRDRPRSPSEVRKSVPPFVCDGHGPLWSLAQSVGRSRRAIVSRLSRTGPVRPAAPPWFVP